MMQASEIPAEALGDCCELRVRVALFSRLEFDDGRTLSATVVDLSASGAGVLVDGDIAVGRSVVLAVLVPASPALGAHTEQRFRARVGNRGAPRQHLRTELVFTELDPAQRSMLQNWLVNAAFTPW